MHSTDTWLIAGILVALLFGISGHWVTLKKAGRAGWPSLLPIISQYEIIKIAGRPGWWILVVLFVPFVDVIFWFLTLHSLARCFDKGVWFALLLLAAPFIAFPILAFGKSTYRAPVI